jgi:hypothetical protein
MASRNPLVRRCGRGEDDGRKETAAMRALSVVFLMILVLAHFVEGAESLALPLSMFRDGPAWFLGYLLFVVLAGAGYLLVRSLRQNDAVDESHVYAAGLCLLLLVAGTPSLNFWHQGASFMLLGLLYLYHATLLWNAGSCLWRVHLFVPVLMLALTGAHSYGLWQKGLILYSVAALNVHHEFARRRADVASERAWKVSRARGAKRPLLASTLRATPLEARFAVRGWGP